MLCDQCRERDAAVQLTTMEKDTVRQLNLCERCAAERGVPTTSVSPKSPLSELLHAVQQQPTLGGADAARCSFCQTSKSDFRASGRLGCAHCYGAFEASLRELLRRVHGHAVHVGRRYRAPHGAVLERAATLRELRARLQRAVEGEEFELAASLRDQIRGME
jgi:protein arginine kinase activator